MVNDFWFMQIDWWSQCTKDFLMPTISSKFRTTNLRSDIITPNVTDITGPISGDTNIAAVMFGALFSIRPKAAKELQLNIHISMLKLSWKKRKFELNKFMFQIVFWFDWKLIELFSKQIKKKIK